ncbi:hypothetical protein JTB14_013613 [Gonioctena quinquepunctata]|nr:hypothetical protein JTB14_013613 [Gonioctena quinquepunctata]
MHTSQGASDMAWNKPLTMVSQRQIGRENAPRDRGLGEQSEEPTSTDDYQLRSERPPIQRDECTQEELERGSIGLDDIDNEILKINMHTNLSEPFRAVRDLNQQLEKANTGMCELRIFNDFVYNSSSNYDT